ncbi:MAG: hypothetical protein ACI8W8_001732 [Rhodothermales bacterium]|jgi:hypothetical protein
MKLDDLRETTREEQAPVVSVSDRVMRSLQAQAVTDDGPLCWLALIGGGVAIAMAAIALVAWNSLLDPLMGDAALTAWGLL